MSILNLFHHRLDLLRLSHVAINQQRIFQSLGDLFGVSFVLTLWVGKIIDDAFRAPFAESFDHLRADAARAAGHQNDFAGKIEVGHC